MRVAGAKCALYISCSKQKSEKNAYPHTVQAAKFSLLVQKLLLLLLLLFSALCTFSPFLTFCTIYCISVNLIFLCCLLGLAMKSKLGTSPSSLEYRKKDRTLAAHCAEPNGVPPTTAIQLCKQIPDRSATERALWPAAIPEPAGRSRLQQQVQLPGLGFSQHLHM